MLLYLEMVMMIFYFMFEEIVWCYFNNVVVIFNLGIVKEYIIYWEFDVCVFKVVDCLDILCEG